MSDFETTVRVCCHDVTIRYWGIKQELTPELEETLTEHAEEHAEEHVKEMINKEYNGGELNCVVPTGNDDEEEIGGWWGII